MQLLWFEKHIRDLYLDNKLDKYGFLQKNGIFLLNLMVLTVLPGVIKLATTGHFFFSMHGKTQELVNKIYNDSSIISAGFLAK